VEYQQEMIAAQTAYGSQKPEGTAGIVAGLDEETFSELKPFTDDQSIAEGKAIFEQNCFPCHGMNGEGGVGPNMTDEYWIHGARMGDVVKIVTAGVPEKGMVPWGPILKEDGVKKVASYVITLRGTNPPNAKAPEGEKVDY
jgi:cytochrome c oxidase cbb3-type subunit 3